MRHEGERPRVVVVDDTRLDREIARDALAPLATVEVCTSAGEALSALRREPADLVISDLHMPGLSGLELLQRVRREHPGTDFVLLTAHATVDSVIEAMRMGASDYLRKPVQPEELAHVFQRTVARRRMLDDNVRLRDALKTVEACSALTPCLEPSEVYSVALDLLLHTVSRWRGVGLFRRGTVALSDGIALRGFMEDEATDLRDVLTEHKPVDLGAYGELAVHKSGPFHEAVQAAGIEAAPALAVPIRGRDAEAGVLFVLADGRSFDDADRERAAIVATHAEISLQNAERYSQAKERALRDDVTDLRNARYLLESTEHELRRAERYGTELSVIFLDLDRFKQVNDRFGHLVGSRSLRQLGQVVSGCVRGVDTVARYGGDEFTVLLVDTGLETASVIAERIRQAVAQAHFDGGPGGALQLTVSLGVATYPQHGRTREALLDASDKAMYRAKSLGRNRVCSASELADVAGIAGAGRRASD